MHEHLHAVPSGSSSRPSRLGDLAERFLPPHVRSLPPVSRSRVRLLVGAYFVLGVGSLALVPIMYVAHLPTLNLSLAIASAALFLGGLALMRWTESETTPATVLCAWVLGVFAIGTTEGGTLATGAGQWLVLLPLVAGLLGGSRRAMLFTAFGGAVLAYSAGRASRPLPLLENVELMARGTSLASLLSAAVLALLYEMLRRRVEADRDEEAKALKVAEERARRAVAEANERRTAALLDGIGEPLLALDTEGRIRFLNLRAERLVGGVRDHWVGRRVREVFPFSQVPDLLDACEQAVQHGSTVEREAQLPDGRWYELRMSRLEDGFCVYLRDITARRERQQAQIRLARQEALRADVNGALSHPGPLDQSLEDCCKAMVRHLDVAVAAIWMREERAERLELKARAGVATLAARLPPRVPLESSGALSMARTASELPVLAEGGAGPQPRSSTWMLTSGKALVGAMEVLAVSPLEDEALAALGALADTIAQGIERRRAQEELAARAHDLTRSNVELEQFAYVASHDLQEPLRMVTSYTQLLGRRFGAQLGSEGKEYIDFAVQGCHRMKRLILDLLDYSRVGTRARPFAPVDVGQVLGRTLEHLAPTLGECGGRVTFDPLPVVQGDETQLGQVIQNLIGNALKFRAPGVAPHVHVSAQRSGEEWIFSVRDNGIGIAPEYFERIFEIFQRLHAQEEYGGTGIGLAICKKIVERHRGRIWVESAPGEGSTFSFSLPAIARAELPAPLAG